MLECRPLYLSICLSTCLSIYLSMCLSMYFSFFSLSIHLSICLSICFSFYPSIELSFYLSICLCFCLSVCLSTYKHLSWFKFGSWQHQKRSKSARLPQTFTMRQHQKRSSSARLPAKMKKLSAELTASCQRVLNIFPLHLSKILRPPGGKKSRSYEVLRLSRTIIFANLLIWCSKM